MKHKHAFTCKGAPRTSVPFRFLTQSAVLPCPGRPSLAPSPGICRRGEVEDEGRVVPISPHSVNAFSERYNLFPCNNLKQNWLFCKISNSSTKLWIFATCWFKCAVLVQIRPHIEVSFFTAAQKKKHRQCLTKILCLLPKTGYVHLINNTVVVIIINSSTDRRSRTREIINIYAVCGGNQIARNRRK